MTNSKLANIYVINNTSFPIIPSPIITPIYTRQGIAPTSQKVLTSDVGDNIADENDLYAEYTTYYWVWKNQIPCKYTGFFQYRRYISLNDGVTELMQETDMQKAIDMYGWDEATLNELVKDYDIIIPQHILVYGIANHYRWCNPNEASYLDEAVDIIKTKYPDYALDCETALTSAYNHCCNMFIMKTELFNTYMEWIFDIFSELKQRVSPSYNRKTFAYIGERLFNVFLHHCRRVKQAKIKVNPWIHIDLTPTNALDFKIITPYSREV